MYTPLFIFSLWTNCSSFACCFYHLEHQTLEEVPRLLQASTHDSINKSQTPQSKRKTHIFHITFHSLYVLCFIFVTFIYDEIFID